MLLAVVQLVVFLHPAALRAELRILPRAWTRAMVRAGWLPPRWWLPPQPRRGPNLAGTFFSPKTSKTSRAGARLYARARLSAILPRVSGIQVD